MPKLAEIRNYLLKNLGLHFNDNQEKELYAKLGNAASGFDFEDTDKFIQWLMTQSLEREQIEKLAVFLTIGETYFFREKKALDYLEFTYLPELINTRKGINQRLRIWSAGCASGEEPYSIAILLQRAIPDIEDWNITILATDINAAFMQKARKGIYTKWSFRNIPESFKTRHFDLVEKNKYQVIPSIKKMVTFSYLNLAEDSYPSLINDTNAFDIILCRNVLIYFSADGIRSVSSKLYNSLVNNGVLLVSPVESSNLISSKFYSFTHNGITVYTKDPEAAARQQDQTIVFPSTLLSRKQKNGKHAAAAYKQLNKTETNGGITMPANKTEQAATPLKQTAQKKVTDIPPYYKLLELYKAGSFDEVEKLTDIVINSKIKDEKSYVLLFARAKANKGKLDESEKLCLRAIHLDKVDAEAHYLLATILSEQGKVKQAVNSLNNTLFLNPDFALGHFLLGNISMHNGMNTESIKHFSNALKCLNKLKQDEIIAEADGLTAGNLSEIIHSMKKIYEG